MKTAQVLQYPTYDNGLLSKHHTILFNIAAYTVLKLSKAQGQKLYALIEDTMNGDGLYEGADRETILEAYFNQNIDPANPEDPIWTDLLQELIPEIEENSCPQLSN
jgi:hypothetical protein